MRSGAFALIGTFLLLLATGGGAASTANARAEDLSRYRQQYGEALEAIDRGNWTEYRQLRPGLDDYALAIYLDYNQLTRQANAVRPADARRFISLSDDTPLPNRFLSVYLHQAGKQHRWKDFLAVKPDEPNSVELKCYYFRARLATGDPLAAWEGTERLWVHGESRPKQCDPLFDAWLKSGQLSDDAVWARMLLAFEQRQTSLLKYVARKGSDQLKPWSDTLLAVYRKPDRMRDQTLPDNDVRSAEIASHGLARLARYNPALALQYLDKYRGELAFTAQQIRDAEYAIALHGLFAKEDTLKPWLEGALDRLDSDKLVGIRLRWALAEGDWLALEQTLPLLSEEERLESAWRYWQARALEIGGDTEAAKQIYSDLAGQRGYYSFLSADRLGRSYAFNHRALDAGGDIPGPLRELPALQRIGELKFHEEASLAHSEWSKVLRDRKDSSEHQQLAHLAYREGWYRMAIDAANHARDWDALDLRFPMPYQETFSLYSGMRQVPTTELMAIARRESAFYPEVRSPVGARGLMQVMPATGKQVASGLGIRHRSADLYNVNHNVLLGSAYYRQLLDRYDGNRVYALAAYNAGPHRVDRWRNKAGEEVPVEVWIETIPYRETRNYVQAVLSYNVVFQYLLGNEHSMLSTAERTAGY